MSRFQRERRFVERPRPLADRDFEVLRLAPLLVRLLAVVFRVDLRVVFRVDLRVAAAERVLLVLARTAFPRLLGDFLVVLRLEAATARLPPAERFVLPRLLAAPLDVVFFLVEGLFPR
jgi:hypothetical protein